MTIKPVENKNELLERLHAEESKLRALGMRRLSLFGSFARDEQGPDSDVDVLIEFDPAKKTFDNFMQIVFLLEANLGRRIELVTTEALSPHIGPRILSGVEDVLLAA